MAGLMKALLTERCLLTPCLGEDMGGTRYGEKEERRGRLETGNMLSHVWRGMSGDVEENRAKALLFLPGPPVSPGTLVEVRGRTYKVLDCREMQGFGFSHLEVVLT